MLEKQWSMINCNVIVMVYAVSSERPHEKNNIEKLGITNLDYYLI